MPTWSGDRLGHSGVVVGAQYPAQAQAAQRGDRGAGGLDGVAYRQDTAGDTVPVGHDGGLPGRFCRRGGAVQRIRHRTPGLLQQDRPSYIDLVPVDGAADTEASGPR